MKASPSHSTLTAGVWCAGSDEGPPEEAQLSLIMDRLSRTPPTALSAFGASPEFLRPTLLKKLLTDR